MKPQSFKAKVIRKDTPEKIEFEVNDWINQNHELIDEIIDIRYTALNYQVEGDYSLVNQFEYTAFIHYRLK